MSSILYMHWTLGLSGDCCFVVAGQTKLFSALVNNIMEEGEIYVWLLLVNRFALIIFPFARLNTDHSHCKQVQGGFHEKDEKIAVTLLNTVIMSFFFTASQMSEIIYFDSSLNIPSKYKKIKISKIRKYYVKWFGRDSIHFSVKSKLKQKMELSNFGIFYP